MGQQQSDNPVQPLMDLYNKWTGKEKKPAPAQKPDTSWHDNQVRKANDSFAKSAQSSGTNSPSGTSASNGQAAAAVPGKTPSYKKGGMVKKTGLAKLHAGEKVIRKKDVKRTVKAVRKYGGKR